MGGEEVGELGVVEDVVANPAAGEEASLCGVDDGSKGVGEAGGKGAGGDLDVGVDACDRSAVGEVAGIASLWDEGVVGGALTRRHGGPGTSRVAGIEGSCEREAELVPELDVQLSWQAVRTRALAALCRAGGGRELLVCEWLVAGGSIGGSDGGVEGGKELVLSGAACWAGGEVAGVVVGDELLGVGEAVGRVKADIHAITGVQHRGEGGVAEVAGVAASVEVVSGLLEEHELQCPGAIECKLGVAVVVGLQDG
jgi:hypothetical protein